jgi:hypothetical protein
MCVYCNNRTKRINESLSFFFRKSVEKVQVSFKCDKSNGYFSVVGGLGVSVLASGTHVRGFKPGRNRRIFKGGKFLSTPSFGREVKPWVPCRRSAACKRSLNVPWKSASRQKLGFISPPIKFQLPLLEGGIRRQALRHLVAELGTSKSGGTISKLGCSTSVACHGSPRKQQQQRLFHMKPNVHCWYLAHFFLE